MKHVLIAAAATVFGATMALADPVHGTWQTAKDDNGNYGHIEVTNCGSTICGTLVKSFNPDGSNLETENVGKKRASTNGRFDSGFVSFPMATIPGILASRLCLFGM